MNWNELLEKGVSKGILPASAVQMPAPAAPHPWPLMLMSFFGALLAALPVIAFIGTFFGDALMREGVTAYVVATLLIGGVAVMLRQKRLPLFVESLSLTFLLAGLGLLYFALERDLDNYAFVPGAFVALALASMVPVRWVQGLLATVAATMFYGVIDLPYWHPSPFSISFVLTGVWLGGLWWQRQLLGQPGRATWIISLEWMLGGWIMLVVVLTVALPWTDILFREQETNIWLLRSLGVVSSAAGGLWMLARWPQLRTVAGFGLLAVMAALAGFMPALGLLTLIGLVAMVTGRWLQAGVAALGAAVVIGRFYYVLEWDLVTKAEILLAAGIVLVGLAWWAWPRSENPALTRHGGASLGRLAQWMIGCGALATLAVVNIGIRDKEDVIAHGRPVFVRLAPVDPRSLMQGDYMALNFEMAPELDAELGDTSRLTRPKVAGPIDANGVVRLQAFADKAAAGDLVIELSPGKRGWVVVTDAWFFKEGDGERWSKARYGEFRVMPDGKALLVGMADEQLRPIQP